MKKQLIILLSFLLIVIAGYSQEDSVRTKNDKPGTPQSLRTTDQTPQSHVQIINTALGQTTNHSAPGNTGVKGQTITTNINTTGTPVQTSPLNTAPRIDTTIKNSAIRNGVSNVTNPIRNN